MKIICIISLQRGLCRELTSTWTSLQELGKRKTVLVSQLTALKTLQTEKIGQYKDDLKGRSQTAKNLKDTLDKLLKTKNDVAFLQGKSKSMILSTGQLRCGAQGPGPRAATSPMGCRCTPRGTATPA